MQKQCQQQHQSKEEGIDHADAPGVEIAPVLPNVIHGVQSPQQAEHAPAGRPQGRQRRQPQHCACGIGPGAVDQLLHRIRQCVGQESVYQRHQSFHLNARKPQNAQKHQQRRKDRQDDKVSGIGRVQRDLLFPDCQIRVHGFSDQTAFGKFSHPIPPFHKRTQPAAFFGSGLTVILRRS